MDNTETIDTAELLDRLLAVMPACWLELFVARLEQVVHETGNGRTEVEVYHRRIVQVNQVIRDKR